MRKRAFSTTLLAAALAATALGFLIAGAEATRTVTIASHVSIRGNNLTFSGRVTASNSACDASRKVTLYTTSSLVLGSTKTNSAGHWQLMPSGGGYAGISKAHFYARVSKRSEGAAGTIYVCKAARSKKIPYSP